MLSFKFWQQVMAWARQPPYALAVGDSQDAIVESAVEARSIRVLRQLFSNLMKIRYTHGLVAIMQRFSSLLSSSVSEKDIEANAWLFLKHKDKER